MINRSWRYAFSVAACLGCGYLTALQAEPPQPAATEKSAAEIAVVEKPVAENAAVEKSAPDQATKVGQSVKPEKLAQWIKELDHDDFKTRQQAKEHLIAAGKAAIEPLEAALQEGNLEVLSQGMAILRTHSQGNNAELRDAAKAALEKIRAGNNATAAQRAREILEPAPAVELNPNTGRAVRAAPGRFRVIPNGAIPAIPIPLQAQQGNIQLVPAAQIQIQARAIAENGNGERQIKVNENGKEVEITENKEGIKITQTENGKTQEYKAKDVEELKKNHAEGYKLYGKYAQNGPANAAIQIGVPLVPGAIPVQAVPRNAVETQLKLAERMLEQAETLVQRIAGSADHKEALKATLQKFSEARSELRKAAESLAPKPAAAPANNAADELEKAKQEIERLREEIRKQDLDQDSLRKKIDADLQDTRMKLDAEKLELQKKIEVERVDLLKQKNAVIDDRKSVLDADKAKLEKQSQAEK